MIKKAVEKLDQTAALLEMQRATRNYAKRQVTWFRREPTAEWITVTGDEWVEPLTTTVLDRLEDSGVHANGVGGGRARAIGGGEES